MRILRVVQKLYPEVTGGGTYHAHALSRDQVDMGHDVTVLTIRDSLELPDEEERDGYRVIRKDCSFKLLGNTLSKGVWNFLKKWNDFDVIHAHSHLYFSTVLAAIKRKFKQTPLVITNHGFHSQNASEAVQFIYHRTMGKWTLNSADLILNYTEGDCERLEEYGITTPAEVVSNGVEVGKFNEDLKDSDDLINENYMNILFVGRLVEGKRPLDAIKIAELVAGNNPNVKLHICGEGPLEKQLKNYVKERKIGNVVNFLGEVDYEDMPSVYRSCDVFLLPSEVEGMPRSVMEAMAAELPCVITRLEHYEEKFVERILTFGVGEIQEAVQKIEGLVDAPHTREKLGERGRHLVEKKYSWQETVRKTTKILANVAQI